MFMLERKIVNKSLGVKEILRSYFFSNSPVMCLLTKVVFPVAPTHVDVVSNKFHSKA